MRYTGIQPQYFPRLHYFARAFSTDIFILRDDVQFVFKHKYPGDRTDKSYQAHTPLKQSFGRQLLSVSIRHEGRTPIIGTHISYDQNWADDHLNYLKVGYDKAPFFEEIIPPLKSILEVRYPNLAELNLTTFVWGLLSVLGEPIVEPKDLTLVHLNQVLTKQQRVRLKSVLRATDTTTVKTAPASLSANEKILALIKEVGADEDFCGGTAHQAYMDDNLFKENGIKVTVQDWKCQAYPQQFMPQLGFIPNLSLIDLLMNVPKREAFAILTG